MTDPPANANGNDNGGEPPLYRFSCEAMATHFEIVVAGAEKAYAGQAADAAFADIQTVETELSRFRPDSDVGRLRALKAGQSTKVGLAMMDCLALAKDVSAATQGAFDVAVGPIYELWRTDKNTMRPTPSDEAQAAARARSGSHLFELDPEHLRVHTRCDGLQIDLGAIGKGYALDQAADVLREWGVTSALLNAGDSTVLALGPPPGSAGWRIGTGGGSVGRPLVGRALSGSGFSFKGSHIIDPRSGRPVPLRPDKETIWAAAPTAALADALSTAFMVMDDDAIEAFCAAHGDVEVIRLYPDDQP